MDAAGEGDAGVGLGGGYSATGPLSRWLDDVISEAAKSVHGRHLDDECEDVVNEGVESLIGHHPPTKL